MVKAKFVFVLLVVALFGYGGWGYNMYQLSIVNNNNTAMAAELEELRNINAEQKKLVDLVEADVTARAKEKADYEARLAESRRKARELGPEMSESVEDLPDIPMGWDY